MLQNLKAQERALNSCNFSFTRSPEATEFSAFPLRACTKKSAAAAINYTRRRDFCDCHVKNTLKERKQRSRTAAFSVALAHLSFIRVAQLRPYTRLAIRYFVRASPATTRRVSPGPFWLWCFGASRLPPPPTPVSRRDPPLEKPWSNRIRSSWSRPSLGQLHATVQVCLPDDQLDFYAHIICFPIATTFLRGN